jgi:2-polyprenyl-3-methyl-5-hydroxy-6-metoxy-1,4-benzoquinol methylase
MIFPIIDKIPIIWDDFSEYVSSRIVLGGKLFRMATHQKMKKFLKDSLSKAHRGNDDRTELEERWSRIYQNSKNSKFYSIIKNELRQIPKSDLVLEHGCSIGLMTSFLADYNKVVFGIDRSYSAISIAKKSGKKNLDYFVSDSLSLIFGKTKFDLILALNVLELIEPLDLLNHISKQINKGFFVISDPYDFDRGKYSVKKPLDEIFLRKSLYDLGFSISNKTRKPSFHPWNLKLSSRSTLNYKVDFIVAKK